MKVVLIILAILVILPIVAYAYYGGFEKISFKIENQGGETIVYENVTGDHSQRPKVSDRIYYSLLNDENIATTKVIGIYYDNPRNVEFLEIYDLVKVAFQTAEHSDGDEQDYVNKLRKSENYIPEFALTIKDGTKIIGHIMLTRTIITRGTEKINALLLSPICTQT